MMNVHDIGDGGFAYNEEFKDSIKIQTVSVNNRRRPVKRISFKLRNFNHLMKLDDNITNAFAKAAPETNFLIHIEGGNLHVTVYCEDIQRKYLKLWYDGDEEDLKVKISENQWNRLRKLSDLLMYKALYFEFKKANFRLAFEVIANENSIEIPICSKIQEWNNCRIALLSVLVGYFLEKCGLNPQEEAVTLKSFVTAALEMDINLIAGIFFNKINRRETVAIDFLDCIDLGKLLEEVYEILRILYNL